VIGSAAARSPGRRLEGAKSYHEWLSQGSTEGLGSPSI
jgi:hypothetical protein